MATENLKKLKALNFQLNTSGKLRWSGGCLQGRESKSYGGGIPVFRSCLKIQIAFLNWMCEGRGVRRIKWLLRKELLCCQFDTQNKENTIHKSIKSCGNQSMDYNLPHEVLNVLLRRLQEAIRERRSLEAWRQVRRRSKESRHKKKKNGR